MTEQTKIALITGGSRGLGKSMALHLADHGVDAIVTYKTGAAEAEAVVAELARRGRRGAALALDVADAGGYPRFADAVGEVLRARWGRERFDFLVHNAGTALHVGLGETTAAQLDEVFAVHLRPVVLLTQRLVPLIHDGGRILTVSSGLARFTLAGYGAYAAMKGAVEVLTRYWAKELGARRITVNAIAPGAVATDFGGGAVRDNPEMNRMIASTVALGRVGLPDDIGGAVALLLAPEAGWINGQRIEVSGGTLL
jgi:NAD(P)-dependent dehydrogenase (short-subunit alcohol dehydrogenase family)